MECCSPIAFSQRQRARWDGMVSTLVDSLALPIEALGPDFS